MSCDLRVLGDLGVPWATYSVPQNSSCLMYCVCRLDNEGEEWNVGGAFLDDGETPFGTSYISGPVLQSPQRSPKTYYAACC